MLTCGAPLAWRGLSSLMISHLKWRFSGSGYLQANLARWYRAHLRMGSLARKYLVGLLADGMGDVLVEPVLVSCHGDFAAPFQSVRSVASVTVSGRVSRP